MFKGNTDILKVAFDTTLEGMILTDSSATIVMANTAVEQCLGYKIDDLVGQNINILVPNFFKEIHKKHYNKYIGSPDKLSHQNAREINGLHKNGNLIPLEIRLNSFTYNGEKFAKALITDISERKEKETNILKAKKILEETVADKTKDLEKVVKKLRDSNNALETEIVKKRKAQSKVKEALIAERELGQLKTRFISLASHEFRTPLSGILTSADLINRYSDANNTDVFKHVSTIKSMVKHLSNILEDFLSLERLDTGNIQYKFSTFNINALLEEIIAKTNSITKEGQQISFSVCEKCPNIYQDKKIIQIIITNILFNAIKYSPKNSKIAISLKANEYITIDIKDTGIGIPEKDQKLIFKRFYRGSNATNIQGTGIGLNIVKANIESLGGNISFVSTINKGTTFTLKIPFDANTPKKTE